MSYRVRCTVTHVQFVYVYASYSYYTNAFIIHCVLLSVCMSICMYACMYVRMWSRLLLRWQVRELPRAGGHEAAVGGEGGKEDGARVALDAGAKAQNFRIESQPGHSQRAQAVTRLGLPDLREALERMPSCTTTVIFHFSLCLSRPRS